MRKIHVELVDSIKNSIIAVSKRLPSDLPDKLEKGMILEIMGEEWSVTEANPFEKSEFIKTKRLRIKLVKISYDNPKDTLFSLPTISDEIEKLESETKSQKETFSILEDDWRQLEFISAVHADSIAEELEDIRSIYMDHSVGIGFNKIHARSRIPRPFSDKSIRVSKIKEVLQPRKDFKALSYYESNGVVSNSFAWETVWGHVIWGHTDNNGMIQIMCITRDYEDRHEIIFSQKMAQLTDKHDLYFVDWKCGIKIKGVEDTSIKYFSREEQMKGQIELDEIWKGKERVCPKCRMAFTSIQNKGNCPKCGFVFYASHPTNSFQHPF